MKKLALLFLLAATTVSCGGGNNSGSANNPANNSDNNKQDNKKTDGIEVLYFHGKQRCITCRAIESLTKEVLTNDFANEFNSGKIVFKEIDISQEENKKVADTYQVTWSSLFINKWENNKETRNDMTKFGFSYAKNNPDSFKVGIKNLIKDLL